MRKIYSLAALGAATLSLGCATPVFAANPIDIPPGIFVVDQADVLTDSEEKALNARIKGLEVEDGHSLFVVYVDTFSNPADPQKWLGQTADKAGLLSTDSMLAIAVESRKAQFESHSGGKIAKYDSDIFTDEIRPALAEGQWGEAGIAAADGISKAKAGGYGKPAKSGAPSKPIDFTPLYIGAGALFGAAGLGAGGFALTRSVKRRRIKAAEIAARRAEVEASKSATATLIIKASDLVKEGEERLGFIQAEHGDIIAKHVRKTFDEGTKALDDVVELQNSITEEDHPDALLVRAWKSAQELAASAVKSLESLEAVAVEYLENISRAQASARMLGEEVAKAQRNTLSITNHALGKSERDTQFRRDAQKAGQSLLKALKEAQAQLAEVQNTADGLTLLEELRSTFEQCKDKLRTAISQMKAHHDSVITLINFEKNLVATARQASAFNPVRHPGMENIAAQCMQLAKKASAIEEDADVMFKRLNKLVHPLFEAVRNATIIEQEIAEASRNLVGALQDAHTALIRAENYISSHNDARHRRSSLAAVKGAIEAARAAGYGEDVRNPYQMALSARKDAKRILAQAKSDVSDAERARRAARSREFSSSSMTFGSSSSSNFGSFSFGPSSDSGFSSGFGSGGAGGSFGGSGGAGGSF